MKKIFLKIFPHIMCWLAGFLLLYSSSYLESNDWHSLFINISAAFISIPLLYLFYEIFKNFSHKKLTEEFYFYTKEQIDTQILLSIGHLFGIVYGESFILDTKNFDDKIFWNFINIKKEELQKLIIQKHHLGFYLFKSWVERIKELTGIISNPLLLKVMPDEQIISLINLRKSIQYLEIFHENKDIYIDTGLKVDKDTYRLIKASDIGDLCNSDLLSKAHPNTGVLFKNIENIATPICSGVILCKQINSPLSYFSINGKYLDNYLSELMSVIICLKNWIRLTNKEFILDPERFKRVIISQY